MTVYCYSIILHTSIKYKQNLLEGRGPHRASFLNVHNLLTSSKYKPAGQRFKYGKLSTHWKYDYV